MSGPETPSAKLAALVVNRLIEAGLLRADKREPLSARISTRNNPTRASDSVVA
jgi:hypothetical protein